MKTIDKYLGEAKFTGKEQKLAQEIQIWSDSLKWAADEVKKAEFENALKSLDAIKKMIPILIKQIKKTQKEALI